MLTELDAILRKKISDPNAELTQYQLHILTWMWTLAYRNQTDFKYDNIQDISTLIYLLLKELKLTPSEHDGEFIEYFNNYHGYGLLIHKMIVDLTDKNPDYYELLTSIKSIEFTTDYMTYKDVSNHIETLYNTEKLSEEENGDTLIFGDNILGNEMTPRELADLVRVFDSEYVADYIQELNIGPITFTISDNSVMYLRDSAGFKLATITPRNGKSKYVIRYTNDNGSALFVLFEPTMVKNETIYGLSLDSNPNGERGLLILEKEKDGSVYRFLYGRSEF